MSHQLQQASTNFSAIWRKVNQIKRNFNPTPAPFLNVNNSSVNSPTDIAEVSVKHFSSTCSSTANNKLAYYIKFLVSFKKNLQKRMWMLR